LSNRDALSAAVGHANRIADGGLRTKSNRALRTAHQEPLRTTRCAPTAGRVLWWRLLLILETWQRS
jgi:hypothetical protein